MEGGRGAVPFLDMQPPRPPLEPEAGSNLLNSKLTYIFRFFTFLINQQYVTICPFYDHFSNSFLYLHLIYNIFFRGVSFKMIGNFSQMNNSQPSGRLISIFKLYFFLIPVFRGVHINR